MKKNVAKNVELYELFICYNHIFIDFKIISVFQNCSQICSVSHFAAHFYLKYNRKKYRTFLHSAVVTYL